MDPDEGGISDGHEESVVGVMLADRPPYLSTRPEERAFGVDQQVSRRSLEGV